MSRHKPTLRIDFLYRRDHFPQEEVIKVIRSLPPPDELSASFYKGVLKEEYLDVIRAVLRLLVASRNETRMNHPLRTLTAMARQNFKVIDAILTKMDIDDLLDGDAFDQDGYTKSFYFSAEQPDKERLVEFLSNESVFRSFREMGIMFLTFRRDSPSRFPDTQNQIEVYLGPVYHPPGDGDQAVDLYHDFPSVMRKIKKRKMHRWQSFVGIANKDYIESSADPRLFEYAAAVTQKIISSRVENEYALMLTEEVIQDDRKCSLFSPREFQASLDKLMRKYC